MSDKENGVFMVRPKTQQEREYENLPRCPWDGLSVNKCGAPEISVDVCRACIVKSFRNSLWSKNLASATSMFHAFVYFYDTCYVPRKELSLKDMAQAH